MKNVYSYNPWKRIWILDSSTNFLWCLHEFHQKYSYEIKWIIVKLQLNVPAPSFLRISCIVEKSQDVDMRLQNFHVRISFTLEK